MKEEQNLIEFDDNEAIAFILNSLPQNLKANIDDDTVQYVLDLICEYYDSNGLIEEDEVEEAEIAEDDMFNFISELIKKEKVVSLTDEQLQAILDAEFNYGLSIGIYSEEED